MIFQLLLSQTHTYEYGLKQIGLSHELTQTDSVSGQDDRAYDIPASLATNSHI